MNCKYCGAAIDLKDIPAPQPINYDNIYREVREEKGRLSVENEDLQKENARLLHDQKGEYEKHKTTWDAYQNSQEILKAQQKSLQAQKVWLWILGIWSIVSIFIILS